MAYIELEIQAGKITELMKEDPNFALEVWAELAHCISAGAILDDAADLAQNIPVNQAQFFGQQFKERGEAFWDETNSSPPPGRDISRESREKLAQRISEAASKFEESPRTGLGEIHLLELSELDSLGASSDLKFIDELSSFHVFESHHEDSEQRDPGLRARLRRVWKSIRGIGTKGKKQ